MKLAPHLYRIGDDVVSAYLVETEDGVTAIDAGLPGHWNDFVRELSLMGRSPSDVKGLILTHGDSDHIGFAERLRRDFGVPVYVHAADAERARGADKPKTAFGTFRLPVVLGFLAYMTRKGGLRPKYLTQVVEVADGDVLDLPGSPVIVGMPGHSPGSIAVHIPIADAVFVGDALTTRSVLTGKTGLQPAPFTDEPATALDSLSHLAHLDADWLLPGHGAPWRGDLASVETDVRDASG